MTHQPTPDQLERIQQIIDSGIFPNYTREDMLQILEHHWNTPDHDSEAEESSDDIEFDNDYSEYEESEAEQSEDEESEDEYEELFLLTAPPYSYDPPPYSDVPAYDAPPNYSP